MQSKCNEVWYYRGYGRKFEYLNTEKRRRNLNSDGVV